MSNQPGLPPDAAVYVISVAAELSGLHPQTLRAYERMGLIMPGRTGGGGRRYSHRDVELLREIAFTYKYSDDVATRDALRQALTTRPADPNKLPVVRQPDPSASLVVWRRSRH